MTTNLIKSPLQLKYELENVKQELTSLLNNSKKKKQESLSKMLNFRAEIKEIDAVMAAREESYTSYCALAQPLLNLVIPAPILFPVGLAAFITNIHQQIEDLTAAAETEACRITRLRAAHQTQLAFIQRKSKEIYLALNEEKKSVEAYASLLKAKMQELEGQFIYQTNQGSLGIGL
ncbi:hypothetical protein [Adhaeribacter rhizoryzae]|uniref:Flagellar FliJ protein n=1 Tax=Adhaeribacter rhizoryzae TaxID=2607907 RepID=A0A5M6CY88_9BACT|nr:hypothetical protein [Adhaeribacter rhizoryzae]KAA5538962.1 hypothetical protein F0145_25395 [Adhaeribacter rhizoryzae]